MRNTEQILKELDEERNKFTQASDKKLNGLISELVEAGVYVETPMMQGKGCDFLSMVMNWGVRWHEYSGLLHCPHCDSDWRDLQSGPPFKRELGMIENDRCSTVICPDCGTRVCKSTGKILDTV